MSNNDIAKSLRERFPRTKDFNAGGVKYVLGNWKDPTRSNDQVLDGGVKKKKSAKALKPSAGLERALDDALGMGSPSVSDKLFSPTTQSHPKVASSGQTTSRPDNPRSMTMLASQNSLTPSPMQSEMASMAYPNMPGSQAYPNGSSNRGGQRYPVATTAGSSIEDPYAIDDGGKDVAAQNKQGSSHNQQHLNPYKMGDPSYPQQYNYSRLQLQNGQKRPAMSSQMTGYMNEQTQNVRGGFRNPARVGLDLAGQFSPRGCTLQNFFTQPYKQASSQGPAQLYQASHGLSNTNSPSIYRNSGGNFATGNAGINHGLPTASKSGSGNNMHIQGHQPTSHQGMFGPQNDQTMMGNVNNVSGTGRNDTNFTSGSRPPGTPQRRPESQNMQEHSSSKPLRALDEFDFNEAERFFPEHHLFGAVGDPYASSVSMPQTESCYQNGGKRKRQEEGPGQIQMSAVTGAHSNSDQQTSQSKRQKKDDSGAMMAGGGERHCQTSQATSQFSMRGPVATAGPVQPKRTAVVGSEDLGYNEKALRLLQHGKDGQVLRDGPSLWKRHQEFLQDLMNDQEQQFLTPIQQKCAAMYSNQLKKFMEASQTNPGTNTPTLHPRRGGELAQGSHVSGIPNSSLSYAEQEEQFRRLEEKVPMGINAVSAQAPIFQPSQNAAQRIVGNIHMIGKFSSSPLSSSTSGAGIAPPQSTTYMNRAEVSPPQTVRVAGHKFDGPPVSQPTPNMNRPATAPAQPSHVPERGATIGTKSQPPEHFNRPMSAPQRSQSNGNGANTMRNTGGSLPKSSMGRPSTVSSVSVAQTATNPAGLNTMQVATPQLASISTPKSTPPSGPTARPPLIPRSSASMHLPQTQQGQGYSMNRGVQASNYQQAQFNISRANTSSSTDGPYQSPYMPSVESRSSATPSPQPMHDQSLNRAVISAVAGGTSAPAQISGTKTPSPGSKSGPGSEQNSSSPTVSPSSGSEGAIGGIEIINGVPIDLGNANMVELAAPIFHQHFTFPTEREGWKVTLNHIDEKYTLVQGNNIIIIAGAQFMDGVTWPNMSNQAVASSGSKTTAPKPRRRAPAKKTSVPSSATATTNATAAPTNPSSRPRTSTTTVPAPSHPPLWPGEKLLTTASTKNTSTFPQPTAPINVQNKPDLHLELKNVSSETSMPQAGQVEKQTEAESPKVFTESSGDSIGEFDGYDDDDLFGDGEVFYQGNNNNQDISDVSVRSGDQTSDPSSPRRTLPNPGGPSPPPKVTANDAHPEGENLSFLDHPQPANGEILTPKSIILSPTSTQEASNDASPEAQPRHVHFEDPKPVEGDILTSENQVEWRARHPIYQPPNPFANAKKNPSLPRQFSPKTTPKSKKVDEPMLWENLSKLEQEWALERQAKWLQDVFPNFPSLERLDVNCINRPPTEGIDIDAISVDWESVPEWSSRERLQALIREDFDDHGDTNVRNALRMLAYVRKWGELCTQFDECGRPIMDAPPDPSRKAYNEQMRVDLAGVGAKSKATADFAYHMVNESDSTEYELAHLDYPGVNPFMDCARKMDEFERSVSVGGVFGTIKRD
ncbi:hypothetical protein BKA64DRAFT_710140 [Cadophora sp. MPI-SDFR-AT-0126]|nr:hypothetical protein BKA64DRAFT_710140 [Leotiomycetes sp. MPI-SDFR-AT-0126]